MKKILLTIIIFVLAFLLFCCSNKQDEIDFNDSYLFIEVERVEIIDYTESSDHRYGRPSVKEYHFDEAMRSIKIDTSVSDIKKIDTTHKFILCMIIKQVEPDSSTEESFVLQQKNSVDSLDLYYGTIIGISDSVEDSKWCNIFGIDCNQEGEIKMGFRFGTRLSSYPRKNVDCEIYKEFILKPNETFCDSLPKRDFSHYNDDKKTYNFNLVKETFTVTNRGFIKKSNVNYYQK